MKSSLFFISLILTASTSFGFVAAEKPLISKSSGSGFVPPEYQRSETCNVYADHVVILKTYGTMRTSETRSVNASNGIQDVLAKAVGEKVTETANGLCDGPVTQVNAFVDGKDVVLYTTGGCGSPKKHRSGPYTAILLELVGSFCPQTY